MKEQKYKLIEKAYWIDLMRIKYGSEFSPEICHAKNLSKAKSILFKKIKDEEWKDYLGDPITLKNIPVARYESYDRYEFEGKLMTNREIQDELKERKRTDKLNNILADETIKYCHISKHGSYYRPNSAGYTEYLSRAGVYDKNIAVEHARKCSELYLIPINVETHNRMVNDEIADLQSLLIPAE